MMKNVYVAYSYRIGSGLIYFNRGDRYEYGRQRRDHDTQGCFTLQYLGHTFYIYPSVYSHADYITREQAVKLAVDLLVHNFRKVDLNAQW